MSRNPAYGTGGHVRRAKIRVKSVSASAQSDKSLSYLSLVIVVWNSSQVQRQCFYVQ